jgi:hypothetical protein
MLLAICGLMIGGVSAGTTKTVKKSDTWKTNKNSKDISTKTTRNVSGSTKYFKYKAVQWWGPNQKNYIKKSVIKIYGASEKSSKIKSVKIHVYNQITGKNYWIIYKGNNKNSQKIVLPRNIYIYGIYDAAKFYHTNIAKVSFTRKVTTSKTAKDFWDTTNWINLKYKNGKYVKKAYGTSIASSYVTWIKSKKVIPDYPDPTNFQGYLRIKSIYKSAKIKSIKLKLCNYKTGKVFSKTFKGNGKNKQTIKLGKNVAPILFGNIEPYQGKIVIYKYTYNPQVG